jgi:hypothetical protein
MRWLIFFPVPGIARSSSASLAKSSPKLGVTNHCRPCETYLGGVAAMFTTLAFFLIAVLLMLGVIADSLWGRFKRR